MENRKLKHRLEPRPIEVLKTGDRLAMLELRGLDDSTYHVSPNPTAQGMLLLLLSTTCPACEQSFPALKDIAVHARIRGYEVVGVSLHDKDKTRDFVARHAIDFAMYFAADTAAKIKLKANAVPQTIFTNGHGIIWNNWIGIIDSAKHFEIIDSLYQKTKEYPGG